MLVLSSPVSVLSHRGEFNKVLRKHVGLSIGFPQDTPARLEQHVKATAGYKLAKPLEGGEGVGEHSIKVWEEMCHRSLQNLTLFKTNILLLFCIELGCILSNNIMELIVLEKLLAPHRLLTCSLHTLINWAKTHSVKDAKYCNCIPF